MLLTRLLMLNDVKNILNDLINIHFQYFILMKNYRLFSIKVFRRNATFYICTIVVYQVHELKISFLLTENLRLILKGYQ